MTDEIREVLSELRQWGQGKPFRIQYRCSIVAHKLRRLAKRPDNLPLRIQTMKNVEELARATGETNG